ncbi:transposase, partial [Nitrospinota bacterium]
DVGLSRAAVTERDDVLAAGVLVQRILVLSCTSGMPSIVSVYCILRRLRKENLSEDKMHAKRRRPRIPLPKSWPRHVKSAVLHVISLAHYAIVRARGRAAGSAGSQERFSAENERLREECALLGEEMRIKDLRMTQIPPQKRPRYRPHERMVILELRAARGLSIKQTADTFLITQATVSSWMLRIDEKGPGALLQLPEPVNKFSDYVRYLVQRLKTLCPMMGKVRIADTLCRAGLHLGATTVGRILKEDYRPSPDGDAQPSAQVVKANRPNHIWHVDLTTVPTSAGFWAAWLPFSLPQRWPFCWWVGVVLDHYSRRVMRITSFKTPPTSSAVQYLLDRTIDKAGSAPKHLISDKASQFWCAEFMGWCDRKGITPRFGAVGKKGSIAVIERFIRSLKRECIGEILVPLCEQAVLRELELFADWYNVHRPHSALAGQTPAEVYRGVEPACQHSRYEPRARWPRGSPCAAPQVPVSGNSGAMIRLEIGYQVGRRHLPIVSLKRAA